MWLSLLGVWCNLGGVLGTVVVGVVNSVGSREQMSLRQPWAQTPAEPLPAVRPWTRHTASHGLRSFPCGRGFVSLPTSPQRLVVRNLRTESWD